MSINLTAANTQEQIVDIERDDFYTVIIQGNFDGATVDIAVAVNEGDPLVSVEDSPTTADRAFNFLNAYSAMYVRISGGGGAENVNVNLKPIRHR